MSKKPWKNNKKKPYIKVIELVAPTTKKHEGEQSKASPKKGWRKLFQEKNEVVLTLTLSLPPLLENIPKTS